MKISPFSLIALLLGSVLSSVGYGYNYKGVSFDENISYQTLLSQGKTIEQFKGSVDCLSIKNNFPSGSFLSKDFHRQLEEFDNQSKACTEILATTTYRLNKEKAEHERLEEIRKAEQAKREEEARLEQIRLAKERLEQQRLALTHNANTQQELISIGVPVYLRLSIDGEFHLKGTHHGACAGKTPENFRVDMTAPHFKIFHSWVLTMSAMKKHIQCKVDKGCGTDNLWVRDCQASLN